MECVFRIRTMSLLAIIHPYRTGPNRTFVKDESRQFSPSLKNGTQLRSATGTLHRGVLTSLSLHV